MNLTGYFHRYRIVKKLIEPYVFNRWMILTEELTKHYSSDVPGWKRWGRRVMNRKTRDENAILAVDKLNMNVGKGEIFGFIGPNGAGKTTTIKMLVGLMPPSSGRARVCGFDIGSQGDMVRGKIGYMPEAPAFYPRIPVVDVLEYYSKLYSIERGEISGRIRSVLSTVGLGKERGKLCGRLSFGMKKRLSLAQALLNEPSLLILDEPTGGLDPAGKRDFRGLLKRLSRKGITIFMSSHLLEEVQKICTHVGIINNGRLVAGGSMEDLQGRIAKRAKVKIFIKVASPGKIPNTLIEGVEGVTDVTVRDDEITVMGNSEEISSEINKILVQNNCKVRSIIIEEPELEDIFFDYTSS